MSVITPEPHLLSAQRWRGLRIGILGGSFNPPHAGHLHIAKLAMTKFKLDAVWWLVSPGNPLKGNPKGDLQKRLKLVRDFIADQPRMTASDIEAQMGTRFTYDTVAGLSKHFPQTKFLWIAGMDNAQKFDQWQNWQDLPNLMPFAFYDRPGGAKLKAGKLKQNKAIPQRKKIKKLKPGVYWIMNGAALDLSSTALRQRGD
ncbi:MAG TPA: nicotinate (nicotinamide) nucleotide adenylyltransferase [Alphaproteobacteria bacterium]